MDGRSRQFRESVSRGNRSKTSGRRHFTEAQRKEAVAYFERRRGEGASVARIAAELGVGKTTLERWRPRGSRFVRVEAVADSGAAVALVSPSGYRIEGLSLEQAVGLLSRLG